MVFSLQGAVVLVVDDMPVTRHLASRILQDAGVAEVLSADSAEEALETLIQRSTAGKPVDVILMDIVLPGMDGLECVRRIRNTGVVSETPVILVTAKTAAEDLQAGFEAGGNDYIGKPIRAPELLARVGAAVALRRERQLREAREADLRAATAELERANASLRALSNTDPLTGLANRRRLDEYLQAQFMAARREQRCISFIMLDVDNFKAYNDRYGHPAGDRVLRDVAEVLRRGVRRASDLAARYGGEELAAVLPHTPLTGALQVAESIREAVIGLAIPHEQTAAGYLTVSLGAASTENAALMSPAELIAMADEALYRAKSAGRNRVCAHDGSPPEPGAMELPQLTGVR